MGAVVAATATKDASRMLLVTARQGRAGQESQTDSERERAGRGEQSRAEKGKRVGRAGVRAAAALFRLKKFLHWAPAGQLRRFPNKEVFSVGRGWAAAALFQPKWYLQREAAAAFLY